MGKRRWIELIEDETPEHRLSSNRFGTLWVIIVLTMLEVVLVRGGIACQDTWRTGQDCWGPVKDLAEIMAWLAVGIYGLARAPAMFNAATNTPSVTIQQPSATQTVVQPAATGEANAAETASNDAKP